VLPYNFHIPAAAVLIAGGLLACFFGYRLFRLVLGVYGFILGALIASSLVAASNTAGMLIAAGAGGLIGAALMFSAYFVGVVIVGAGLGAMAAYMIWAPMGHDPSQLIVILFAVIGAIGAWISQRYIVIAGTAFGGAWTAVGGMAALVAQRRPSTADAVWLAYPLHPAPGQRWFLLVWLVLSVAGLVVQLTGKQAPAKKPKKK
jgi:Domain of unknown function (DUF4203)